MVTPVLPSDYQHDYRSHLASLSADGSRRWIDCLIVAGRWRRLRRLVSVVLIAVLLVVPLLRFGGMPLVRIDLPGVALFLAGHRFGPEDALLLVFSLMLGIFGLLFITAVAGRVYCGWLCPHSVILELVVRPIQQFCRRGLPRTAPMGLLRKAAYLGLTGLVCGALANSLTALFVGPEAFIAGLLIDPQHHPAAAVCFAVIFGLLMFDLLWFREQMCLIVCPYGRLQAVMIDDHTPVVAYDAARGEPRGRVGQTTGDCIDCHRCVAVCPTGIDIRHGVQVECIHCAACIDACDDVMLKVGRKPGLLRYASLNALNGLPARFWRFRTLVYSGVLTLLCGLLLALGGTRTPLTALALRSPVPVVDASGPEPVVRQLVVVAVNSRAQGPHHLQIGCTLPGTFVTPTPDLAILPGERKEVTVFLLVPVKELMDGPRQGAITLQEGPLVLRVPVTVMRP